MKKTKRKIEKVIRVCMKCGWLGMIYTPYRQRSKCDMCGKVGNFVCLVKSEDMH